MLEFLGEQAAHDVILKAVEDVLRTGPHTPDVGGSATTRDVGEAIAALVAGG